MSSNEELLNKLKKIQRYAHVWDWLEEDQYGEYVKWDDVLKLIDDNYIEKTLELITEKQLVSLVDEFIDNNSIKN